MAFNGRRVTEWWGNVVFADHSAFSVRSVLRGGSCEEAIIIPTSLETKDVEIGRKCHRARAEKTLINLHLQLL